MNDVTILNTFYKMPIPWIILILLFIGSVCIIFTYIHDSCKGETFEPIMGSFTIPVCIFLCIVSIVGTIVNCCHKEYWKPSSYEVIINDDAKFKDVYNNYKIIEKRGDIYIIEERKD